jgi:single-stranded-DNA-specific exonuclease
MLLQGMETAVTRIHAALDNGERVLVFGDYDVDGVTATALLYTWLDAAGADVYYKLPNREEDGYGLSPSLVEYAAHKGVNLIITVDNGVSAYDAIVRAAELGVDVIVTDHHLPPQQLPPAVAVIDPQLPTDISPCKTLCGAGVAFKLVCALESAQPEEMLPFYGDFAAIGTIADIMMLEGENRTLVKAGLALLQNTDRPGLAALIDACGLGNKELTAENVSFGLAPRLNAAGRMDSADLALRLLLSEDEDEAAELVQMLDERNAARQSAEQTITKQVLETIEADPTYQSDRILVVAGEGYHPGVIGIVASRVVERTGKPAIIVSIDENDEGKGSGRSVEGISLHSAIASCADLLIRYGGHDSAAGLSVRKENLAAFRKKINEWAAEHHPMPVRAPLHIDAVISLAQLSVQDVEALSVLAPFGNGNPPPLFLVENAVLEAVYPVSEGKHTRLRLRQGTDVMSAVLFGKAPEALGYAVGDRLDVVLALSVFEGRSGAMVSARVRDLRPAGLQDAYIENTCLVEAFCCGAQLSEVQRAAIRPQRADTAALYRAVSASPNGISADDLRPLFAQLGEQNAGKALVSLLALEQLGLLRVESGMWRVVPTAGKKDLAAAPVLQKLEG